MKRFEIQVPKWSIDKSPNKFSLSRSLGYFSHVFFSQKKKKNGEVGRLSLKILTQIYARDFLDHKAPLSGMAHPGRSVSYSSPLRTARTRRRNYFSLERFHISWSELAATRLAQPIWRNGNNQLTTEVDRSVCENGEKNGRNGASSKNCYQCGTLFTPFSHRFSNIQSVSDICQLQMLRKIEIYFFVKTTPPATFSNSKVCVFKFFADFVIPRSCLICIKF